MSDSRRKGFDTKAYVEAKKLSTVPSKLLQQSLDDLEAVESKTGYAINMGTWVSPVFGEVGNCHVCHAGAMLVNRLNEETLLKYSDEGIQPEETNIYREMQFINAIRIGRIIEALYHAQYFIADDNMGALAGRLREELLVVPEEFKNNPQDFNLNLVIPDPVLNYEQPEVYKDYIRSIICFFEAEGL